MTIANLALALTQTPQLSTLTVGHWRRYTALKILQQSFLSFLAQPSNAQ